MYRSVLVPLDGSAFGEQALPLALEVARRAGAKLHVVHVQVPLAAMYAESAPGFDNTLDPRLKERERAYVDGVVKRLTSFTQVPVTSAMREGAVAEAILEETVAAGADLVVMTTHGRGPLSRFWLGSVADELVRRLTVPTLLVRPHDQETKPNGEFGLRHILVPLDGSVLAEEVLPAVVKLGRLTEADYTLLRVVQPITLSGYDPTGMALGGIPYPGAEHEQAVAQAYVDRVARRLQIEGLRVQTAVALNAQPAVAILDEARQRGMDLIALETHGRRGIARLMLGSVADKVVRGASIPVLVHRLPAK